MAKVFSLHTGGVNFFIPLLPLLKENHPFMNKFTPPTKITLSLSKVNLIFLYHIPMLYTLFAIPVTAHLHLEDIAYTLMQNSVFHFLAMYTYIE